jgi:predicted RNA binding protein YcfA (HicA-like mRNA interferase family)
MRPDELLALLEMHGFKRTRTRGSHCVCSDGTRSMTVPLNVKELKRPYIAEAIRLLGLESANDPQD